MQEVSGGGGKIKGWIIRTDTTGKIISNIKIGPDGRATYFMSIIEKEGRIYTQGETNEYFPKYEEKYQTLLYAFTSTGTPLWRRIYSDSLLTNKRYLIYRMKPTLDNGFAMIGFGRNPNTPDSLSSQDVWFLKVDSNGCLYDPCIDMTVGMNEEQAQQGINLYPNPTNGILKIESEADISEIIVYNLLGQKVFEKSNIVEKEININFLDNGIYLVKIITKSGFEFLEKVIKQ